VRASLDELNELREKGYDAKNSSKIWRDKEIADLQQKLGMK